MQCTSDRHRRQSVIGWSKQNQVQWIAIFTLLKKRPAQNSHGSAGDEICVGAYTIYWVSIHMWLHQWLVTVRAIGILTPVLSCVCGHRCKKETVFVLTDGMARLRQKLWRSGCDFMTVPLSFFRNTHWHRIIMLSNRIVRYCESSTEETASKRQGHCESSSDDLLSWFSNAQWI